MMKFNLIRNLVLLGLIVVIHSCSKDDSPTNPQLDGERLTIFFINDPHGQIWNFSKVKHIVDREREINPTLVVSAGDLFSGNPIVDQHPDKGYPIIEMMNEVGFDISVIGNHEFDYGLETLQRRIDQSEFEWICANMDVNASALERVDPYKTLTIGDTRVTFLGLVETYGRIGKTIPATHPWKIDGLSFEAYDEITGAYSTLKEDTDADLLIALTHLGLSRDIALANEFPFFDLIIGGHSNDLSSANTNGIPVLMAGANLQFLGKAQLVLKDNELVDYSFSMINLWDYQERDEELHLKIDEYYESPLLTDAIGFSETDMDLIGEIGCFYTTALKEQMDVDLAIQNLGGIRSAILQGDITKFNIFTMDPFNNGSVIFEKSVGELKQFLDETGLAISFTGLKIALENEQVVFRDSNDNLLPDNHMIMLGINDFIPALYDEYFPIEDAIVKPLTTAETIIDYLENNQPTVNFEGCDRLFWK